MRIKLAVTQQPVNIEWSTELRLQILKQELEIILPSKVVYLKKTQHKHSNNIFWTISKAIKKT